MQSSDRSASELNNNFIINAGGCEIVAAPTNALGILQEIPTTSAAAAADNRSTRSGRSASVASTGAAPAAAAALPAADQDTEDEETPRWAALILF